jgi:tetratricopeptide (TPR) repeat protein
VALVFLALLGFVAFIAGVFFLIGLYFSSRGKSIVYAAFLVLLVSPLMGRTADIFLSPPSPELRAIVAVNEGKDNRYALMNLKPGGDFAETFSHALALKREGYYEQAIALYKTLISQRGDPLVYINLGNAFYALKNLEAATEFYKMSIGIKPLPAAFFNLSQVHRDQFDFIKGEEYFLEAAKLDSESTSRFAAISGRSPNRSVIDEALPISAIWEYAKGKGRISSLPFILGVIMITAFSLLNKKMKVRAHQCKRCGAIFCSKCSRTLAWGDMCPQCYNFLMKMDQMDSRERIERLLSIYHNQTKRRRKIKLLSSIIPGAGQVYAGRLVAGFLFLWLFLFSLSLIVISRFPFAGLFPFTHGWLTTLAIILLSFAYISSIFYMRKGITKGWL